MLEIDPEDDTENKRLNFWIKMASGLIEDYLDRPGYLKQERTEYYNGTGTDKLVLRCRPAYPTPTPQVWVDEGGFFGVDPDAFPSTGLLEYGTDYVLWTDRPDGTSHRAILIRKNNLWQKAGRRRAGFLSPFVDEGWGTVKVTYVAGWTADDLPQTVVAACTLLVSKIRFMYPLGLPVSSDSYEGRSVSIRSEDRNWLFGQIKHLLHGQRTRRF